MTNKKPTILIIAAVGLIVVLAVVILVVRQAKQSKMNNEAKVQPVEVFKPEFLTAEEKQALNIPVEANAQVLKRNAQGGIMVYKLIRDESEAVNPARVKPISPWTK